MLKRCAIGVCALAGAFVAEAAQQGTMVGGEYVMSVPSGDVTLNTDDIAALFGAASAAPKANVRVSLIAVKPQPGPEPELGGVQLWENGPYWAECNVGASKPEEYGYYFWWGDTVGYTREGGTYDSSYPRYTDVTWVTSTGTRMSSSPFSSSTCPTCNKSNSTLQSQGYIDSTGNLVAKYDAATAHLGAPWRMPTDADWSALRSNCTTTWTTKNGVYGRLVTGKGAYASKSIFLPAAGRGNVSYLDSPGSDGNGTYWSSTPGSAYSNYACYLDFRWTYFGQGDGYPRYYGQSVRPLRGFAGANDSRFGSVTGAGVYKPGVAVSLSAKPAAGYVFAGWYENDEPMLSLDVDYRMATVKMVAPNYPVKVEARFIPKVEDAGISIGFRPEPIGYPVGQPLEIPVEVDSRSFPTVTAANLPAGLKFDAKKLVVRGAPTTPGEKTVKFTAKNSSGAMATAEFVVKVQNYVCSMPLDYEAGYTFTPGVAWTDDPVFGGATAAEWIGWTVTGLPAGVKFNSKTGVFSGAPTAQNTSYTLTLTRKRADGTTEKGTVTVRTAAYPKLVLEPIFDGCGLDVVVPATGWKLTGAGGYAANKSVKLGATAPKGWVFAGWYADAAFEEPLAGTVDFRTPSFGFTMPEEDVSVYAYFVPSEVDADIELAIDGSKVMEDPSKTVFNTAGALSLALGVESVTVPKIVVSGLPSGLKFTDKQVLNKDKSVLAEANMVYGTATKPGTYIVTVKLTNTTVKKAIEKKFTIVVDNFTAANELLNVTDVDGGSTRLMNARNESYAITNGVVETCLPVLLPAVPGDKVAVSGLPAGLKYNTKTGVIEGAATKAGTFTVQVKVGISVSTFTIIATPLPEWAVGTFVGLGIQKFIEVDDGSYSAGESLRSDSGILFNLTISTTGKCSCKVTTDYGSVSIKDLKLVRSSSGELLVFGEGAILPWDTDQQYRGEFRLRPIDVAGGAVGAADLVWYHTRTKLYGVWINTKWNNVPFVRTEEGFPLLQNAWGSKTVALPTMVEGKEIVLETPDKRGLVLKFGKKGAVTAALWNRNASRASVTASGQLSLCGYDSATGIWQGQVCLILMDRSPNQPGEAGVVVSVEIDASGVVTCIFDHYEYNWR